MSTGLTLLSGVDAARDRRAALRAGMAHMPDSE